MFPHVVTGEGMEKWDKMSSQFNNAAKGNGSNIIKPNYYPFSDSAHIIQSQKDYFRRLADEKRIEGKPLILIELGTGSESAIRQKTIPFIEAIRPDVYIAVDMSPESAFLATTMVRERFELITTELRIGTDFNKDSLDLLNDGRRIMVQFGSTIGNMEGFPDGTLPRKQFLDALNNYHRHLGEGDVLILDLDHTQDIDRINSCYRDDPGVQSLAESILDRIQDEVSSEFQRNKFEYFCGVHPKSSLNVVGYIVKEDHSWKARQTAFDRIAVIHQKKGSLINFFNSYKPTVEFMGEVFREANFRERDILVGPEKGIHFHVQEPIFP